MLVGFQKIVPNKFSRKIERKLFLPRFFEVKLVIMLLDKNRFQQ